MKAEAPKRAILMVTRVARDGNGDGNGNGGRSNGDSIKGGGQAKERAMAAAMTVAGKDEGMVMAIMSRDLNKRYS